MLGVDLFTEILRWFVWIALILAVLVVILWIGGQSAHNHLRKIEKRVERRQRFAVYDQDEELETHDMYPRSNVHIPDRIPEGWDSEWR